MQLLIGHGQVPTIMPEASKIICVDENAGSCHNLYLVNGESRMHVCMFDDYDLKESMDNFYKRIDTSNVYS